MNNYKAGRNGSFLQGGILKEMERTAAGGRLRENEKGLLQEADQDKETGREKECRGRLR